MHCQTISSAQKLKAAIAQALDRRCEEETEASNTNRYRKNPTKSGTRKRNVARRSGNPKYFDKLLKKFAKKSTKVRFTSRSQNQHKGNKNKSQIKSAKKNFPTFTCVNRVYACVNRVHVSTRFTEIVPFAGGICGATVAFVVPPNFEFYNSDSCENLEDDPSSRLFPRSSKETRPSFRTLCSNFSLGGSLVSQILGHR